MNEDRQARHARELHAESIVIDCHSDILMPVSAGQIRLGTQVTIPDPRQWVPPFKPIENTKESGSQPGRPHYGTIGQYSIPQFLKGGITAQVCAVFVEDRLRANALETALDMVWWMHKESEENDSFSLVTTTEEIRRIKREGRCGGILALEGFEPVGYDVRFLDLFYRLGVRMGGLAHNRRNAFSDGTQYYTKTGGLTDLGKQAIGRMNELGMVVDLGHLNQVGYWEALETTTAPAVLSHRSPLAFFPPTPEASRFNGIYDVSRGKERLEALARNGGVFGVFFLGAADVGAVVDDIEYVIDTIGPDHVGLGSDLYGIEQAPKGLEDIGKVPAIAEALVRRGHPDDVIQKVLGGNFMRVFDAVWR